MVFHGHRHRIRQSAKPATAHFVIGVHNRLTAVVSGVEQPFRRFVVLHIAMVIQVIAAQVGEDRGGKLERRDAVLHQAVGRDFHRRHRRAFSHQACEHVLDINGRTGGVFRRDHFPQQAVAYGAHHRAGFAQQLAPLRNQLRGGGFAVSAGHANQMQAFGRLMVKTPGQRRQTFV